MAKKIMVNLTNIIPTVKSMHIPHISNTNNTSMPQDIKLLVILYTVNQLINLQLLDSSFCPISLFEINEFLDSNAKNITCSLLRIVSFIRQRKLKDKTMKNIMQITKFGSAAWGFLSTIYKAG